MTPHWEPSAFKHGIPKEDQIYAMLHGVFRYVIEEDTGHGRLLIIIGPAHPQTNREVEILVRDYPASGREAKVFHAMQLGSLYRRFREEHPDGWTR